MTASSVIAGQPSAAPASPGTFAIEAHNLVRRFGQTEALARVSVNIRKGEFFSLLGPSGCGKTTLLRLIAGLDLPDSGALKIGGRDAASIPAHKRPVNTVFQSYALFPHLSVHDNVAFGLRMKKIPAREIAERVERIMALVQITPFADRRPAQLSGGQKQRVALARALVNEPEVLLLDEPLGALDLKLRKELQVELSQLQRRLGITFIFVTHDQEEALVMSDRIAVMNAGKIEQLDGVEELYEQPRTRFVARFLGSCNLLEGCVTQVLMACDRHRRHAAGRIAFRPGQSAPRSLRGRQNHPRHPPGKNQSLVAEHGAVRQSFSRVRPRDYLQRRGNAVLPARERAGA